MPKETFVVAYEGGDRRVLDYAIERAKKDDAKLILVHVLAWSPYSFLTPQEIEERHERRQNELTRAQEALVDPAVKHCQQVGIEAEGVLRYGSVVDLLVDQARKSHAGMIFVGRAGSAGLSARVFGSVAIGLAQAAPVPTVIVP